MTVDSWLPSFGLGLLLGDGGEHMFQVDFDFVNLYGELRNRFTTEQHAFQVELDGFVEQLFHFGERFGGSDTLGKVRHIGTKLVSPCSIRTTYFLIR